MENRGGPAHGEAGAWGALMAGVMVEPLVSLLMMARVRLMTVLQTKMVILRMMVIGQGCMIGQGI